MLLGAAANPGKELGAHPTDGKKMTAAVGRYGPYVRHGCTCANLPKGREIDSVTLEEAIEWIAARNAKMAENGGGKKKPRGKKKAPAAADAD